MVKKLPRIIRFFKVFYRLVSCLFVYSIALHSSYILITVPNNSLKTRQVYSDIWLIY
jgi:hypothetical protein